MLPQDLSEILEETHKQWEKISHMQNMEELSLKIDELQKDMGLKNWEKDANELKSLGQKLSLLEKEKEDFTSLSEKISELFEMASFLKEGEDEDLANELLAEFQKLKEELTTREFRLLLSGEFDSASCYLSINAGAGGTESNDWASMLLRLYTRWATSKGYIIDTVDELPGEEVGIKNTTLFIKGDYAYGFLKGEQGVHRLVRISPFDANKKRHTSFASVSVFPEISEDVDVQIQPSDLRIDTFRASGAGGQHVNKTESAIRIVHIPTGITVTCQQERSQHKNRDMAMKLLKNKLYTYYQEQKNEDLQVLKGEKKDIAWGNQIRSYVFQPYRLIKDHRTQIEIGNVQKVMDGDLDPLIFEYLKWQYTNIKE